MRALGLKSSVKNRLLSLAGSRFAGLGVCLMYHRIAPAGYRPEAFAPNLSLHVGLEDFERQMRYVSEAFHCIGVDELAQGLREGRLKPGSLLVTFDDGYRDNLELALPVLRKYGVPAAIYVTTGYIDRKIPSFWWFEQEALIRERARVELEWNGERLSWDTSIVEGKLRAFNAIVSLFKSASPEEQQAGMSSLRAGSSPVADGQALSWDEVRALDRDPLISIGAHAVSHSVMARLNPEELRRELAESKSMIEQKLGHSVGHFAYPFGGREHAGAREFAAARDCGYETALTTRPGRIRALHGRHLHAIPRVSIGFGGGLDVFLWRVNALGSLLKRPWGAWVADA